MQHTFNTFTALDHSGLDHPLLDHSGSGLDHSIGFMCFTHLWSGSHLVIG